MSTKQKKQRPEPGQALLEQQSQIAKQAVQNKPQNYTLDKAKQSYKVKDSLYDSALQATSKVKRLGKLDAAVGRKMRKTIIDELQIPYSEITAQDQKALDYLLIEDDFVESLKNFATTAGKFIKPYVKPIVKQFAPALYPIIKEIMPSNDTVNKSEGVRIRRRYLLRTVEQLVSGQVQQISVNPGLSAFGQWLAIVSKAYQFYQVHGLTFEYVSSTALTTAGTIAYYLEMDKNAPTPGVVDIGQQYKSTTHALYQNSTISYTESEIHQMVKRFHVRNENIQPEELSIYDAGTFYYVCSNQTTTSVGQFYVDIDVSFHVPTLQGLTNNVISQYYYGATVTQFKLPENPSFIASVADSRDIAGFTSVGYQIQRSGRLYGLYIGAGSNSATVSPLTMYTAASPTAALYNATTITNRVNSSAGNKVYVIFTYLDVSAGSILWISKSNTDEMMNQNHNFSLTYDPNIFPTTALTSNSFKKISQLQQDQYLKDQQERDKEMKIQIDKQAKMIQALASRLPKNKQESLSESFDFD